MNPNTTPMPGRPKTKIEINFKEPNKNFDQIERLSQMDEMKAVLNEFALAIIELVKEKEDISEDTQCPAKLIEEVLDEIPLDDHEIMVEPICDFVNKMNLENQSKGYSNLGKSLNKVLYEAIEDNSISELNLADLQKH